MVVRVRQPEPGEAPAVPVRNAKDEGGGVTGFPPCDAKIFAHGKAVCTFHAASECIEPWVKRVATESGQPVDWHYCGGYAVVLYLGDYASVRAAVERLKPDLIAATENHEWGLSAFRMVTE
jgi:hypothetical protein